MTNQYLLVNSLLLNVQRPKFINIQYENKFINIPTKKNKKMREELNSQVNDLDSHIDTLESLRRDERFSIL